MEWLSIILVLVGCGLIIAAGKFFGFSRKVYGPLKKVFLILVGFSLMISGAFVLTNNGMSYTIGKPTSSINIGQEYQVIGIAMTKEKDRYLTLKKNGEIILYETTQDKIPFNVTSGDVITVLENKNIIITKDYPYGCSVNGCG